jgi:hypothetical protein
MALPPAEFYFRWKLNATELARICGVSQSTSYHWLGGQTSHREAGEPYQRLLAMMDLALEHADDVAPLLRHWLQQRNH